MQDGDQRSSTLNQDSEETRISRRTTLKGGVGLALSPVLPAPSHAQTLGYLVDAPVAGAHNLQIDLTVNGNRIQIEIDARTSLLDLCRERLGLTGAKKGCDHGQCGACTMHIDGRPVASCLTLAAKAQDHVVTTIEGLADGERLHPMQQAFIDHDALQCGYCTPGQVMAAVALVQDGNATSKAQIRELMSGNLCRCGAYVGIVAAIEDAASKMRRI